MNKIGKPWEKVVVEQFLFKQTTCVSLTNVKQAKLRRRGRHHRRGLGHAGAGFSSIARLASKAPSWAPSAPSCRPCSRSPVPT